MRFKVSIKQEKVRRIVDADVLATSRCASASMASIRPRSLPPGWYPKSIADIKEEIETFLKNAREPGVKVTFMAGVAPHAGRIYSGKLACNVFKQLTQPCDTIVIVGGQLHPLSPAIAAFESI